MSRSTAMSLHLPPSRYPAPSPVIQASTEADLQNRQGRCLRNSCVPIVPVADKRPFPPAIMLTRNWTLRAGRAVTTLLSGAGEDHAEQAWGGQRRQLGADSGRQVLDRHREVIGRRSGLLGVQHVVRAHRLSERSGHANAVDAPSHAVSAVDVIRVMTGGGVPVGTDQRGGIVQAARPQHVPWLPVRPVPAPAALVVIPLALVDKVGEPVDPRVRVGGLVEVPALPGPGPVRAFGVPVGADQGRRYAVRPGDRGHEALVLVGPERAAERGRVEGAVPDRDAADVQGDHGQAVPEETAATAAQRAGERLDAVPPHQSHVIAVAANREGGYAARLWPGYLAAQAGIVRELAQPPRGRRLVGGEDFLDGE